MPTRGFSTEEFESRVAAFQRHMAADFLDAAVLTQEAEIRYFSGFLTQFWESPTRPWFLIIPAAGEPIAVIPEIGRSGMAGTWISQIHSWPAPRADDEGVSLLSKVLDELPRRHGRIGFALGPESYVRQSLNDFERIRRTLVGVEYSDIGAALHAQRWRKSPAEIDKIRHACTLASDCYEGLADKLAAGMSERDACRLFQLDALGAGADRVPFLIAGSGPGGYNDIIMGPTDRVLDSGDLLIIDTGVQWDGYFSDFDRNYGFGRVDDATRAAYETVYRATDAGLAAAKPGATLGQLFDAMWGVMDAAGALGNDVGRIGHGLGMQLTEWPSIIAGAPEILEPGMVLTLEPGMSFAPGKMMVHEEDIVITESGAELLSRRAAAELPIVGR